MSQAKLRWGYGHPIFYTEGRPTKKQKIRMWLLRILRHFPKLEQWYFQYSLRKHPPRWG